MTNFNFITLFVFGLLFSNGAAFSDTIPSNKENASEKPLLVEPLSTKSIGTKNGTDTSVIDTLHKRSILNSFFNFKNSRQNIFIYDSTPDYRNPYHVTSSEFYRKDATSMADGLQYHPLITTAKFGLANSLNRYLFYGTVAPVSNVWTNNITSDKMPYNLFPINFSNHFSTETEALLIENNGIHLLGYPVNGPVPETVILWENGVFDENLLDVRVSRPLSRNIMINVFSNYRHFKGTHYTHDGNNVYNFYKGIYKDSSLIAGKGYYPQVEEHSSGVQLTYKGNHGNALRLEFSYGDLLDEIAINKIARDSTPAYQIMHHFPTKIDLNTFGNNTGAFFWDLGTRYLNEPVINIEPQFTSSTTTPNRNDGCFNGLLLTMRTGAQLRKTDSMGVSLSSSWAKQNQFDKSELQNTFVDSRLFYKLNYSFYSLQLHTEINGGIQTELCGDSLSILPAWHAGMDLVGKKQHIRAYLKQDNIPYSIPFDTLRSEMPEILDNYFGAGIEYFLHTNKMQLLLGYQFLSGINESSIVNAWPSKIVPYEQPRSVLIIAPSFGRWNGFALSSSGSFSDHKPYMKAHGNLSYVFHPLSTSEFIDINLGIEYWSERNPITFAGQNNWNKSFCNLDLEIAAHIMSFRLFYKVDNILNRKFAYVPGYYNSGLTFRWGFNWFIQR